MQTGNLYKNHKNGRTVIYLFLKSNEKQQRIGPASYPAATIFYRNLRQPSVGCGGTEILETGIEQMSRLDITQRTDKAAAQMGDIFG